MQGGSPVEQEQNNYRKFDGLAEIYHSARPAMPDFPIQIIRRYLGNSPDTIVDLGCGTGLSTVVWQQYGNRIIGIDPNQEMLEIAKSAFPCGLEFRKGSSGNTGLKKESVDVVVCSQSFHWMEPVSSLQEISRILKPGGVFAIIDYDWPPVCNWKVEKCFSQLYQFAKEVEQKEKASYQRWNKEEHLPNLQKSGLFRYVREMLFSDTQVCNADKLYRMALSQSRIQTALKYQPQTMREKLQKYRLLINEIWGSREFELFFCYRMRIAVK
ncbi:MAG TPA: class I SAM-dependent methyltransferase [Firmicutes bacterium]|nr:class I SAM-dependent methyltransferase [Bacillota bacterium]